MALTKYVISPGRLAYQTFSLVITSSSYTLVLKSLNVGLKQMANWKIWFVMKL